MERIVIDRLGHLGDGIGGTPAVYVPRVLPGEIVEGRRDGDRLADPRILTPSSERVRAPCPHYRNCGGCDLMHAREAFVADWKADIVRAALAVHGLSASVRRVVTSPPMSRRRAALSARRTKSGAEIGFHARSSDRIVAVPQCRVLRPEITAALPVLSDVTRAGATRRGEMRFAVTVTEGGLDVAASGGKALDRALAADLVSAADGAGLARLTWDGDPVLQAAPPAVRIGGARVTPPPGAFLQATAEGEAALSAGVAEALAGAGRVLDLFAGLGTFALRLAASAEVHAVEGDAALTAALETGWRRAAGLKRVTVETRDLFRRPLLADELRGFDGVAIDPPRAGAEAQSAVLAAAGPPRIAAVSCNPRTFARDTARLAAAGYRLDWIDVVDQFRWSPHVELVAGLTRAKK